MAVVLFFYLIDFVLNILLKIVSQFLRFQDTHTGSFLILLALHLFITEILLLFKNVLFIDLASFFLDGKLVFNILNADGQLLLRIIIERLVTVLLRMLAKAH